MQQPRGLGGPAAARPMQRGAQPGQQGPQAPQPGPEQGALGPEGGPEQATPEEQAVYNRFVGMFMLALYDDKMLPKTVEFLRAAPEPVRAVAEVATAIGMRVYTDAKEKGVDIPGDVLLHAGREVVALTAEVAAEAGAMEMDPQQVEAAFFAAADLFSEDARQMGAYDQELAQSDLQQLNKMADSGQLDWMMRDIERAQQSEEAV